MVNSEKKIEGQDVGGYRVFSSMKILKDMV
jgi:hypothetical protein